MVDSTENTDVTLDSRLIKPAGVSVYKAPRSAVMSQMPEGSCAPVAILTSKFFGNGMPLWYKETRQNGDLVYHQALGGITLVLCGDPVKT